MISQPPELKQFARELNEEVALRIDQESMSPAAYAEGVGARCSDVALAQVMLEQLQEDGLTAETQYCSYADADGRRRCAVTAYSWVEGQGRLDIFLAVFRSDAGDVESLSSQELAQLTGKAARFFDYASKPDLNRFARHPEVHDAARNIHAIVRDITSVRVVILTNAYVRDREVDEISVAEKLVRFYVVDVERLFRLSQVATKRDDIQIDFVKMHGRPLPCLEMHPRVPDYDTYLAIFSGNTLFDLYERYGQRLFEFNVRAFLQATGKVNKGIRDTLRNSPERFMAYNNGLVATADALEVGIVNGELAISKITGLQIVNGAQTTASLHRARNIDKIDLSKASVAVKITKVLPEKLQEFVPLISRFANTQNTIQVADLSANNEFHVKLEHLSQQIWCPGEESRWFYERARGAYKDALQREGSTPVKRRLIKEEIPPYQKLTKTDLAKHYMAWIGRPHTVSSGAQKNFSVFMAELANLFPTGWEPNRSFYERVIAQAILFKTCERVVRESKFAAYRANIAVYCYSLLSHLVRGELNFGSIWNNQAISDELESFISSITANVDATIRSSAGARNVTEWCKQVGCWEEVRNAAPKMPRPLPVEMEVLVAQSSDTAPLKGTPPNDGWEDQDAIEECMRHDATTWAKLSYWGLSTNALDYYERGVAHTLSEYAASQWVRRPSLKQARIAVRVLNKARDARILTT